MKTSYLSMKTIEIHQPIHPADCSRIYFFDRLGKEVYAKVKDPSDYLTTEQQNQLFLGERSIYKFKVTDSVIKDLERQLNWPA